MLPSGSFNLETQDRILGLRFYTIHPSALKIVLHDRSDIESTYRLGSRGLDKVRPLKIVLKSKELKHIGRSGDGGKSLKIRKSIMFSVHEFTSIRTSHTSIRQSSFGFAKKLKRFDRGIPMHDRTFALGLFGWTER